MPQMMEVLTNDRNEWVRMAVAVAPRNPELAEQMVAAAKCDALPVATFNEVATKYRQWLCFNVA